MPTPRAGAWLPIVVCDTPTTLSPWRQAPAVTQRRYKLWWRRCWPPMGQRLSEEKTTTAHIDDCSTSAVPYPATDQARNEQGGGPHLAIKKGARLDQDDHLARHTSRSPISCARSTGAARLDHLAPGRRLEADLQLPQPLHVATRVMWLRRKHRRAGLMFL